MDADVNSGLALLAPLRQFDEVNVGGNWSNHVVEQYIWEDSTGTSAIPQLLVVIRTINVNTEGTERSVGPYHVITRQVGADAIIAWVKRGAPIVLPTDNEGSH